MCWSLWRPRETPHLFVYHETLVSNKPQFCMKTPDYRDEIDEKTIAYAGLQDGVDAIAVSLWFRTREECLSVKRYGEFETEEFDIC